MPTYANGAIPRSAMKQFRSSGKYGHPVFIDHLTAAADEIKRELGYTLYVAAGQDIFRDVAGQRYWKNYWTERGVPGNAAAVGFSNHGLGVSADISGLPAKGTSGWNRARDILAKYGIQFNYAPEAWHVTDMTISTAGNRVTINPPSTAKVSQTVKNEQAWLNKARGEKLVGDGIAGPAFKAAVKRYQTFLKAYGYKGAADGVWGAGTQAAHAKFYAAYNKPKPKPRATIKQGSKGADVKYLQSKLGLAQDSIFGPATKAKVVAWQRSKGLVADGIVGAKTWAKLG